MEKIILLGSGGHAKSIVDTIEQSGQYEIVGFLERPEKQMFSYKDYQVIGKDEDMDKFFTNGIKKACITVGYMGISSPRERLYEQLKRIGYQLPIIVDSTAVIAKDVVIEEGTFIGKNVVINAGAYVGKMSIINTGAIVEHECRVGDYTHIAVGAVLCGGASVGRECLVGANATLIQNIRLGSHVIVGAGSVVIRNVEDDQKVVGNPAVSITK